MKKLFLILFVVFGLLNAKVLQSGKYEVVYKFEAPSVSPIDGIKRYKIWTSNSRVVKVLDLKYGKYIPSNRAYGLQEAKSLLKRGLKSGKYVQILSIKRANSSSATAYSTRLKEFKSNYYRWLKKRVKSYKLRYQGSKLQMQYPEGVEVVVKNRRVVSTRDVRSYRLIKLNRNQIVTVKKLFAYAKYGLKRGATVDYDSKYHYPSYIKFKNGHTITAYLTK